MNIEKKIKMHQGRLKAEKRSIGKEIDNILQRLQQELDGCKENNSYSLSNLINLVNRLEKQEQKKEIVREKEKVLEDLKHANYMLTKEE